MAETQTPGLNVVAIPGETVTIGGLDGIAALLPTNDWYEMRIVFRRVPSGVEVRADQTLRRAVIEPEESSDG